MKVQTLSLSGGRAFRAERTVSENALGPEPVWFAAADLSGKAIVASWAFWARCDGVRKVTAAKCRAHRETAISPGLDIARYFTR